MLSEKRGMTMRLLIAEDELDLAEALSAFFEKNQYTVDVVHDGAAAYDHAVTGAYDGVILDVLMPKLDGVQVLKRLREEGVRTPIMMLTAKADKDDRIVGYDAGADDYLPKPFSTDELLSRVRAMLRRGEAYQPTVLRFGDLFMDCDLGALRCGDREERLSGREYQVMELFMRSPRIILSAQRIMERVWGWDSDAEVNVVWVHISNLRKKLKAIGSTVSIRASRGLGYALVEEDHAP
jgi:DNA-binding response OmpR family regulator